MRTILGLLFGMVLVLTAGPSWAGSSDPDEPVRHYLIRHPVIWLPEESLDPDTKLWNSFKFSQTPEVLGQFETLGDCRRMEKVQGDSALRALERIESGFAIWTDGRPSGGVHRAGLRVGQLVHASQHLNGSHSGEPEGLCDPLPPSVIAAITPSQTPPPRRLVPLILVGWVR